MANKHIHLRSGEKEKKQEIKSNMEGMKMMDAADQVQEIHSTLWLIDALVL